MAQAPLPDEKCQEAVDAIVTHGSVSAAARALNVNRSTFEARVIEAKRRGFISTLPPRLMMKGQSILRNKAGEEVARWDKTKLAGRDAADTFQLPDPKKVTKVSTFLDQQGNVAAQWISEKPDDAERERLWQLYAEKIAGDVKRAAPVKAPKGRSHADLLAVYPVGDHHTGMMAWPDETGDAAYDLKIAEQILRDASRRLIDTCPPCEQALIAFMGDFHHYDSYAAVTPAHKNLLDADGRFPKMVETGVRMVRHVIMAALERHRHVNVIFEGGNHDPATAAFMRILLACLYENEPRVTVDKSPMGCHYFEWRKVLIGTHHGDKIKGEKLPSIMAHDRPAAWGRTAHRVWFTGHVHHESLKSFPGCKVETLEVLPPLDAYAAGAGYRGNRSMKAVVYHGEHGEVERHTVNPGMFNTQAAA